MQISRIWAQRVGWEGNPHVKSKIFLPPALPGEILLACRGQWAVPNGASMLAVACVFHDSNPRSHARKIVRTAASQFLMLLYLLFPHKCIGIIVYFCKYDY